MCVRACVRTDMYVRAFVCALVTERERERERERESERERERDLDCSAYTHTHTHTSTHTHTHTHTQNHLFHLVIDHFELGWITQRPVFLPNEGLRKDDREEL